MTRLDRLRLEENDDVVIANILGNSLLDSAVIQELAAELMAVVADRPTKLVVRFAEVSRCSTEVINVLLQAKKRLLTDGGDLHICEMTEGIRHTFRILNLDGTVFAIFETQEDAIGAF